MSQPNNNPFSLLLIVYNSLAKPDKDLIDTFQKFVQLIWTINSDKRDFIEFKYKELTSQKSRNKNLEPAFLGILNTFDQKHLETDLYFYQLFDISDYNPDAFNIIVRLTKLLRLTDNIANKTLCAIVHDDTQKCYVISTNLGEDTSFYWPVNSEIFTNHQVSSNLYGQDPNNKEHYIAVYDKEEFWQDIHLDSYKNQTKKGIIADINSIQQ